MHSLGLLPLRQPASLFPYPEMANSAPSLALLRHRKPASLLPLPEMARSRPGSPPGCGCFLLASRHRCSLTLRWPIPHPGRGCSLIARRHSPSLSHRWPIPVRGHALAGAAPSSQSGIPVPSAGRRQFLPAVAPCLGLLPLRQPASLSPLPEMATSCPQPCTRWGRPLFASRHRGSPTLRWPIPLPARGCPLFAIWHPASVFPTLQIGTRGHALSGAVPCSQAGMAVH